MVPGNKSRDDTGFWATEEARWLAPDAIAQVKSQRADAKAA